MIDLQDISVRFNVKNRFVNAVRNVSLTVEKGEIFGIVGTSGAGKSTLLRVINLLQRPTNGSITIDGQNITNYGGEDLRNIRRKIGMIFQHFNLLHTKTVSENVGFAMKAAGKKKREIKPRVEEALSLVGLSDKADRYPGQLSGGQKQRVGIARAIVNNPDILLCDEPTSALDLETTHSILELLRKINTNFGITTVLISHEMMVIKEICDRVAVMNEGRIVEIGSVYGVFAEPKDTFTRQLVSRTLKLDLPERLLSNTNGTIVKLVYRGENAEQPILAQTTHKFGTLLNVLHGKIEYINNRPLGILLISIAGEPEKVRATISHLQNQTSEMEVIHDL